MDVYNTTDDMKATELRKNLPHDKGFLVYLVTVIFNKEIVEKLWKSTYLLFLVLCL